MKLLKKPWFAIFLCVIVVLGSTVLSARGKLVKSCSDVTDGFYSGVGITGEAEDSVSAALNRLCDIAYGMSSISENYGIKSADTVALADALKQSLSSRSGEVHSLYLQYLELNKAVQVLEDKLYTNGLSQRHTELMEDYSDDYDELAEDILDSGYNESVQSFMNKTDRFPARNIAAFFGISFPQYFG